MLSSMPLTPPQGSTSQSQSHQFLWGWVGLDGPEQRLVTSQVHEGRAPVVFDQGVEVG